MGVGVDKPTLLQVHHEAKVVKEICSQDGFADVSDHKNPSEGSSKS